MREVGQQRLISHWCSLCHPAGLQGARVTLVSRDRWFSSVLQLVPCHSLARGREGWTRSCHTNGQINALI